MYPPADEDAALPRLSSPNLTDEQVGEPALEVVLEPGDLLYFPRCGGKLRGDCNGMFFCGGILREDSGYACIAGELFWGVRFGY